MPVASVVPYVRHLVDKGDKTEHQAFELGFVREQRCHGHQFARRCQAIRSDLPAGLQLGHTPLSA